MKGIWRFFKRLTKSKTGKAAITLVVGGIVNEIAGDEIGKVAAPIVTDTVVQIIDGVFSPEAMVVGAVGGFLRDKEAKKENGGV